MKGRGMKRLIRPKFARRGAQWIEPNYLPADLVAALKPIARRGMNAAQTTSFLAGCHTQAQLLCTSRPWTEPAALTSDSMRIVATHARALLHALQKLSPASVSAFGAHWDYLAYGTSPPVELCDLSISMRGEEGRFLGAAWDTVADLEASARYAGSRCEPHRQAKISKDAARALAVELAILCRRIAGKLPPYSKETWFPEFMECLCGWPALGLKCGRALVESAVRSIPPD
jgi:hypothetical protein